MVARTAAARAARELASSEKRDCLAGGVSHARGPRRLDAKGGCGRRDSRPVSERGAVELSALTKRPFHETSGGPLPSVR